MITRFGLAVALLGALVSAPVQAKDTANCAPIQTPIAGTTATGEHFNGTLTLQRFAVDASKNVVAVGTVAGTLTNAAGEVVATGLRTVALPGAGNLLGNLLCSVTNVLNNPTGLANLLNQILGICRDSKADCRTQKSPRAHGVRGLFLRLLPAATYSPTQFPVQYHRRYQA